MTDRKRLRELAERATPGPWSVENSDVFSPIVIFADSRDVCSMDIYDHRPDERQDDAAFIAAASPDVVIALLDRIDELETNAVRMREYRFALEGIPTDGKGNPLGGK